MIKIIKMLTISILILLSSCISDPVGIHRFIVKNNKIDTFDLKIFVDKKDSNFVILPYDSVVIDEFIDNSGSYNKDFEAKILMEFDSVVIQSRFNKQKVNLSDYRLWTFKIIKDSMFESANSIYTIK